MKMANLPCQKRWQEACRFYAAACFPPIPHRNRNDAVYAQSGRQRSGTGQMHDTAWFMYHEAECPAEMIPVSWPGFANIHPYAPANQTQGYPQDDRRAGISSGGMPGYAAISFPANSGSPKVNLPDC